jgi:hypothetical protein
MFCEFYIWHNDGNHTRLASPEYISISTNLIFYYVCVVMCKELWRRRVSMLVGGGGLFWLLPVNVMMMATGSIIYHINFTNDSINIMGGNIDVTGMKYTILSIATILDARIGILLYLLIYAQLWNPFDISFGVHYASMCMVLSGCMGAKIVYFKMNSCYVRYIYTNILMICAGFAWYLSEFNCDKSQPLFGLFHGVWHLLTGLSILSIFEQTMVELKEYEPSDVVV